MLAALLLLVMKVADPRCPRSTRRRRATQPPPLWIRGLLILTCTLVSFFHGSNDGQKGMGLIMLILIGVAPTAYALNRALPDEHTPSSSSPPRRPPRKVVDGACAPASTSSAIRARP